MDRIGLKMNNKEKTSYTKKEVLASLESTYKMSLNSQRVIKPERAVVLRNYAEAMIEIPREHLEVRKLPEGKTYQLLTAEELVAALIGAALFIHTSEVMNKTELTGEKEGKKKNGILQKSTKK